MFYIILGTKGQFIKMFPLMKMLDKHKVPYKYVHTSQHYKIIEENALLLGIRKPDLYLTVKKNDLRNIADFLKWAPKVLWAGKNLPISKRDYVLVHSDTESTLLAFIIAKWHRARVIHIESGLRSGKFLEPFPEEIIRFLTDNLADVRFCPYKEDASHFRGRKNTHITNGNTVFDAVSYALMQKPTAKTLKILKTRYAVFLVHRKETLFLRDRLEQSLKILEEILKSGLKVIWPMHANTRHELQKSGQWPWLLKLASDYNLMIENFINYVDFMHLIKNCLFAATDGDGVQEESYYLNKPALILRKVTDSLPGIGENAYISYLDMGRVRFFLKNYRKFKRKTSPKGSPSEVIAGYLSELS